MAENMSRRRWPASVLKLVVLLVLVGGLYRLYRAGAHPAEEPPEETVASNVVVQVAPVTRATLHEYVKAYGVVTPRPAAGDHPAASGRAMSTVIGVVAAVRCTEGQTVKKGDALFDLDARTTDAIVEKAQQAVGFTEQTLARQQRLLNEGGGAAKNLQEAEQQYRVAKAELNAAVTQQGMLHVVAPLAGTVIRLNARPGDVIDVTTVLAEVADLDQLVVLASISSAELSRIKPGQRVELLTGVPGRSAEEPAPPTTSPTPTTGPATRPASPGEPAAGAVAFISPTVDPKTDQGSLLVTIPADSHFAVGQLVALKIETSELPGRLVVPEISIVRIAEGQTVVSIVDGDKAVQMPVKVGVREGNRVEIAGAGIVEGKSVVTVGAYGLPKETKVTISHGGGRSDE